MISSSTDYPISAVNPKADLVIDALLMALWRQKPEGIVLIHSDEGVQYTCTDWRRFVSDNNLELNMSRRGNCHDNAAAESFFSLLKTERIKRKIYKTRNDDRAETFNYIKFFYNPSRRHGNNNGISPVEFEKRYYEKLLSLQETRGLPGYGRGIPSLFY